ncbi:hypothetical protein WJX82_002375 [Trebouxia sp. C0006]
MDLLFARKVMVFGGDFRRVLPVVRRGNRGQAVDAALSRSCLWPHMRHMCLVKNMRVHRLQGIPNGNILELGNRLIKAKMLNGSDAGDPMFIPCIKLCANDSSQMPFHLICTQFPIKPAFAMTVKKAQGQTLELMGLYLPKPVFAHGMLYVALLRVNCEDGVNAMVTHPQPVGREGSFTRIIVYEEVLHAKIPRTNSAKYHLPVGIPCQWACRALSIYAAMTVLTFRVLSSPRANLRVARVPYMTFKLSHL